MIATTAAAQAASIVAAVLIAAVAAFQIALALGVPLGGAVLGGRAPTRDGVLTGPFRMLAIVQAIVLVLLGSVLLARTGAITLSALSGGTLVWLTWIIVGFLVLNTIANFSAPHPVERWVMGTVTLVLSWLALFIALSGTS